MLRGFDLLIVLRKLTVWIDQKCLSFGDRHSKHPGFYIIGFRRLAFDVGKQWEGEAVLFSEFLV